MTRVYWIAYAGKKEYRLTDGQYQFIKAENQKRGTTLFWFDTFELNLSMVSSIDKFNEQVDETPKLEAPLVSREVIEKARQKLASKLKTIEQKEAEKKAEEVEKHKQKLREQIKFLNKQ